MAVGFSNNDILEIILDLDAQDAEATAKKLGDGMDKAAKKAEETKKGFDLIKERVELIAVKFGTWGKLIEGIKSLAQNVVGVFQQLHGAVGVVIDQSNSLQRASLFGRSVEDGNKLSKILSDVKSGMEGLALSTNLSQLGLSQQDSERFAHLVNAMNAMTGEAKAQVEAKLMSATLTERDLGALTKVTGQLKNQQTLQIAMLQAQAKAGGRQLDIGERIRVLLDVAQASEKLAKSVAAAGEANPFDELAKEAKTFWELVVKDLTPTLKIVTQVLTFLGRAGVHAFKEMWSQAKALIGIFPKFANFVGEGAARLWVRMSQGKEAIKWIDELDIRMAYQRRMQESADKKRTEALKEQQSVQKQGLQDQQEAVQEQLSRMAAARAQLRNFESSMLNALSKESAKGIGGIIGGMTAAVELAKQFTALLGPDFESKGGKAAQLMAASVRSVLSVTHQLVQAERNTTAALEEQLILSNAVKADRLSAREEAEKTRQLAQATRAIDDAAAVLAKSRVKQAVALRERLLQVRTELKDQTEQQIHLLRIRRDIAVIDERAEMRTKHLEILKAQVSAADDIRKHLFSIAEIEGRIIRDRGEAARAQAQQLAVERSRLETEIFRLKARAAFATQEKDVGVLNQQISKEQQALAVIESRIMLFKAEAAARAKSAQMADIQYKLDQQRLSIQRNSEQANLAAQNANQRATLDFRAKEVESASTLRGIQAQIAEQIATITTLQKQLALVQPGSEKARELQNEIDHRTRLLALQRDQVALTEQQIEKEKEARTTWGAMVQQLQEQARGMQAKLGGELASGLTRTAQGFSSAFGQMFSDLVTQPQNALGALGKAILSTFGDLAAQLSVFFAAQGFALLFMPGGQASGLGMLAAAAGLAAVGGTLKGVGSAAGSTSGPSSTASRSSAPMQTSIPGTDTRREAAPIQIFVSVDETPWDKPTQQERYKGFRRWAEQMGRSTGMRGA